MCAYVNIMCIYLSLHMHTNQSPSRMILQLRLVASAVSMVQGPNLSQRAWQNQRNWAACLVRGGWCWGGGSLSGSAMCLYFSVFGWLVVFGWYCIYCIWPLFGQKWRKIMDPRPYHQEILLLQSVKNYILYIYSCVQATHSIPNKLIRLLVSYSDASTNFHMLMIVYTHLMRFSAQASPPAFLQEALCEWHIKRCQ